MSNDNIYLRTELGNELLDDPKGRISGDEMLLIALVDGHTSMDGIIKKVPPSVRGKIGSIFARLLAEKIIREAGRETDAGSPGNISGAGVTLPQEDVTSVSENSATSRKELDSMLAQLEANKVRQREIELGFHKLKMRITAYTEVTHARFSKMQREILGNEHSVDELRDHLTGDIEEALEDLQAVDKAIAEEQNAVDKTLRLSVSLGQLDQLQREQLEKDARIASSHPHYKKLRGLDFFRGFANVELLHFLEIAEWQEVEAGDMVLNEGDVGMPFFIIVSGSVSIYRGQDKLATLERGDFFGEFAFLSGEEPFRTARVAADSTCEFLKIDPLDIEFSPVQLRLCVAEALLRGQVRRTMVSSKPMGSFFENEKSNGPDTETQ